MGFLALAQQGAFGNYDPRRQYALAPSPASLAGGYGQPLDVAPLMAPPMPQQPAFTTSPTPPQQRRVNPSPLAALTPEFAASYNALQQPVGASGGFSLDQPIAPVKGVPFALNQPTPEMSLNQVPLGAGARGPTTVPGKSPAPGGGMGGFMGRLQSGLAGLPDNSLFQMGMSLLGNAQNGGDWGQVGRDMQAFADRRRQQQQEDNQTRRAKVNDGRLEQTWSWEVQDREGRSARYDAALADARENDPELYRVLQAVGSDGLAEVMANNYVTPFQRENLQLQRDQIRSSERIAAERLNQDRMLNSTLGALGRDEAGFIGGMRARLDAGRPILRQINELDEILQRNPQIFGAILEGDQEAAIRKFATPGDEQSIADVQRVWTIGADMAREELRGQTPVSNLDLRVAIQTGASTQQTALAMERWIANARAEFRELEQTYQSALNYIRPQGPNGPMRNLYDVDPVTGQNWYQSSYNSWRDDGQTREGGGGNAATGSAPGGRREPTPEEARAELARRRNGEAAPTATPLIAPGHMSIYQRQLWNQYVRSRSGPEGQRAHWERRARREGLIQ